MHPAHWPIIAAMEQHGGSFVQALARAYRVADDDNRRRIREAFPEIWRRYETLSQQVAQASLRTQEAVWANHAVKMEAKG